MTAPTSPFAARLAYAMRHRDMSGLRLAKHLGVSAHTVRSWRTGRTQPKVSTIAPLCDVLRVGPAWLLGMSLKGGPNHTHEPGRPRISRYAGIDVPPPSGARA